MPCSPSAPSRRIYPSSSSSKPTGRRPWGAQIDYTLGGTAQVGIDYYAIAQPWVTVPGGVQGFAIIEIVPILNANCQGIDKTVILTLESPFSGQATGAFCDDPATSFAVVPDMPGSGTWLPQFTVSRSGSATEPAWVDVKFNPTGTGAAPGIDFNYTVGPDPAVNGGSYGSVYFPAGVSSVLITIEPLYVDSAPAAACDDMTVHPDGSSSAGRNMVTVELDISGTTYNAAPPNQEATITISDADSPCASNSSGGGGSGGGGSGGNTGPSASNPPGVLARPSVCIDDTEAVEGDNEQFTEKLSHAVPYDYLVPYATSDGTALASLDYTGESGMVDFAQNTTTQTITVPTLLDAADTAGRYFCVAVGNSSTGKGDIQPVKGSLSIQDPSTGGWLEHDKNISQGGLLVLSQSPEAMNLSVVPMLIKLTSTGPVSGKFELAYGDAGLSVYLDHACTQLVVSNTTQLDATAAGITVYVTSRTASNSMRDMGIQLEYVDGTQSLTCDTADYTTLAIAQPTLNYAQNSPVPKGDPLYNEIVQAEDLVHSQTPPTFGLHPTVNGSSTGMKWVVEEQAQVSPNDFDYPGVAVRIGQDIRGVVWNDAPPAKPTVVKTMRKDGIIDPVGDGHNDSATRDNYTYSPALNGGYIYSFDTPGPSEPLAAGTIQRFRADVTAVGEVLLGTTYYDISLPTIFSVAISAGRGKNGAWSVDTTYGPNDNQLKPNDVLDIALNPWAKK